MSVVQPKFEIKINTKLEDVDLVCHDIDENKMFLSQFDYELDKIFITLNGTQVAMDLHELKVAVDMLYNQYEKPGK